MTPALQETVVSGKAEPLRRPPPGEEVVISGMSGIFPASDSVPEFMDNLLNKVDMVTTEDSRWVFNHPEVPKHLGKVNGMGKFDAQFFRVHYKQACTMEPMSRKLLEHAYSAIYDAGINPLQLRNKKVGVFIGSAFSESEKIVIYENIQRNGFGITGCNKAMYANRISYWIDGKGPSYCLDLACASSAVCLEHAYRSISSGQCEAAIVGGCNLCMHPNVSLNCTRAGFVCLDGKTRCFNKNCNGYVRSDSIGVLFLQKAKYAMRIYSEVYYAKTGYSPASKQLVPVREPKELQQFLEAFYSEAGVSPDDVEYVEANGAAILEADTNELKAVGEVFGNKKPIKIGCVKSNMGSSEPASGICGLTKVCLAYHSGKLPGNLHYDDPIEIPEVQNKVQVLTENENFGRGFAAVNCFSYGGANVHVLLKGHYKEKENQRYRSSIPHLVLLSGRQDNCVQKILDNLKKNPIDPEEIGLIHNIHKYDIPGHMSRGYTILDTNENNQTISLCQSAEYCPGTTRPVWFMYSGMGSQWASMGADLMRIPIFAAAIQKCHKVLEPKGIDIVRILTDSDKTIYDNILHSFVGIAAVQIGLTDILKEIGIVPDHIIGHSVGELGCAYADGCFTAEEMILSAYSRGLVSVRTPFIKGSMAAVGLGYSTVLPMCPPEIVVACHNSSESSTISGPADKMKEFVSKLTSQGIFAKEVPCSNIAYHSKYIADAGPGLLQYLSEVIKNPKERSKKWVSTSVPQDKWETPLAKYSSAEYHTNNLLNSVLFEETSKLIPSDALVIEVAPHGLLQAIVKRSLAECVHVPLTRRGTPDPVKFLLEALGKLYQAGLNLKIDALYPKIEFPVSTGTPFLSQQVEWEHSENWPQAKYNNRDRVYSTVRDFVMSIYDDDYKYFKGHVRNGNSVFPESAFLVLVWETFAMHKNVPNYKEMPVVFDNVKFFGEIILTPEHPVNMQIMIMKGTNKFEITYQDSAIVSGCISLHVGNELARSLTPSADTTENITLSNKDIYTIMKLRGYDLKDDFQSIQSTTSSRKKASIKWNDDWITYLDSIIQFNAFAKDFNGVSLPVQIKKLIIDVNRHYVKYATDENVTCLEAELYDIYNCIRSGGVEIVGLVFRDLPIVERMPDVVLSQSFVPHFIKGDVKLSTALRVNLQIISENLSGKTIKIANSLSANLLEVSEFIKEAADEIYSKIIDLKPSYNNSVEKSNVIIVDNLLDDEKKLDKIYNMVSNDGFVVALEQVATAIEPQYKQFSIITSMNVQKQILVLLRKNNMDSNENVTYMPIVFDRNFSWVPRLQAELQNSKKVILVSERQHYCGLLGMVKKLREEHGNKIGLVVIEDFSAASFNPESYIYKNQLEKKLALNVLKKGHWGGYYALPCKSFKQLDNLYLTNTAPGDLEALSWIEKPIPESSNFVQVCYAGASIRDAKIVTRKTTPNEQTFGMDYSGISKSGDKVMGVVSGGAIGSTVVADPDLLWPVPEHWTLEDAATVPYAYTQAYYYLTIRTKSLDSTSRVLINGCTGELCQALISVALSITKHIYITSCDVTQKQFLLKIFPDLIAGNVGRSPVQMLQKITDDVTSSPDYRLALWNLRRSALIINCLSGSLREEAMKCVGFSGAFLDICDYHMKSNEDFGMDFVSQERSYVSANVDTIFLENYLKEKKIIQQKILEGIAEGVVRPLCRVVYTPDNVNQAFRLISADRNLRKVLIRMNNLKEPNQILNVTTRISYSPKGSYIIVSDGTELSIELADRLVRGGAGNLVIHMIPSSITGYCYTKFSSWKNLNVSMKISSENLETDKGCVNLLKEATKLAPVRGLFIVQNFNTSQNSSLEQVSTKFSNTVGVVASLDLVSRNICDKLEHFVVLNCTSSGISEKYVSSVVDNICRARNEICLPALAFHTGFIKELDGSETVHHKLQPQPLSAVLNTLEDSLKQKQTNIVTYNLKKNAISEFHSRIARVIGVQNIDGIDENLSLNDMLLSEVNLEEINTAIKNAYYISYPAEKLSRMTIAELKSLGQLSSKFANDGSGLGAFITYIDEDECSAAEPVVTMGTASSTVTEEEDLDPRDTYLMLVPGFEGHHRIFSTVTERLKIQAMALQLVPDMTNDSIRQIAANIAKFTRKRLQLQSKFYLLGYSFGVNVALELAKIFEEEGHTGVVYCLDSSPDALRAQLDAYLGNLTDSQLQNAIVQHMYQLMSGRRSAELMQELESKHTWNDKVELCVTKLCGLVNYSHQYKRCLLNSAYQRIILAREYEPTFKLESELVLLKGIAHPNMIKLADDYNLSKYSLKPVKVFDIESDHASAYHDCRVSNIVNKFLEPKLLTQFKTKNLCWSYLAAPHKTW